MNNALLNDYNDNMDILCSSETMLLKESPFLIPPQLKNYTGLWSNALNDKTRGRGSGGLLCLVKNSLHPITIAITPWWILFRFGVGAQHVIVGSLYFKSTFQLDIILEMSQLSLNEIQTKYSSDTIILGGM